MKIKKDDDFTSPTPIIIAYFLTGLWNYTLKRNLQKKSAGKSLLH